MRKYRIIKVHEYGKYYYALQIRKFFCWRTVCDGGIDDIGSYEYIRKFETKQDAKEFYYKWYTKPKQSVVESW